MQETLVWFLGGEDLLKKGLATHSSSWASLVAQLVKNLPAIRKTWVQSLGWEDPLEKGKAIHCTILMGSQRVGHSWVTFTFTFIPEWSSSFPYFLQFKSEFCNEHFMIWAAVSSWSCLCWRYRSSPSLAAKKIINLISVLTIWWCPFFRVISCVVGRGCLLWAVCSLQNSVSLSSALFCTPRPNLPVTQDISWLRHPKNPTRKLTGSVTLSHSSLRYQWKTF